MRVPDDIAVVGWDNIEAAAHTTPSLTTVAPDKGEIARLAVDHVLCQLDGTLPEDTEIVAPYELIVRESTQRPA